MTDGIQLAERAGGGVARVRRRLLVGGDLRLVEALEAVERKEDLATHLHSLGHLAVEHPQRDRLDRAQVRGHVLAALAVAARGAPRQDAASYTSDTAEPSIFGSST